MNDILKLITEASKDTRLAYYHCRRYAPKSHELLRSELSKALKHLQESYLILDNEINGNITFGVGE